MIKKSILLIFGVIFIFFINTGLVRALTPAQIQSLNNNSEYYTGQPNCSGSNSSILSLVTDKGNEAETWSYFIGQGLSPVQTAAVMGNFQQESSFDPTRSELGGDSQSQPMVGGNDGWGLAQWTYPHQNLSQIAQTYNITGPLNQLTTQLEIVWAQMKGTSPTGYQNLLGTLKGINDLATATSTFTTDFEGPAIVGPRLQYAVAILNSYGNIGISGINALIPTSTPTSMNSTSGSSNCYTSNPTLVTVSSPTGYQNPLRNVSGLRPERIDQGVDYGGQGPVYALGDGIITNLTNSGWNYGGYDAFLVEKLSNGPAAGMNVYVAEDCVPSVHIGQTVTSNTVICNITNPSSTGIETGWANSAGTTAESQMPEAGSISGASTCISDSIPTLIGLNYNDLLMSLGATGGIHETAGTCGTLPSGWPTWQ